MTRGCFPGPTQVSEGLFGFLKSGKDRRIFPAAATAGSQGGARNLGLFDHAALQLGEPQFKSAFSATICSDSNLPTSS
jgi:hypothetical protein